MSRPGTLGVPSVRDVLRFLVVTVACVAVSRLLGDGDRVNGTAALALTLLVCAPLLWLRRTGAVVALAVLWVSVVAILLNLSMSGPLMLGLGLVGRAASLADTRAVNTVGLLSGAAGAVVAFGTTDSKPGIALFGGFAVGILPALVGEQLRAESARARAATELARRVEELRDRDVDRAVAEERLRIARDVHDITGHHLSAIALQAAGAGRTTADPAARASFERIHGLTSQALGQTRSALGVLRAEQEGAALAPPPRLAHVEPLLAPSRAAGIDAELRVDGEVRELSETVEMCAYRVIQESLTNVVRHAAARSVRVVVDYGATTLTVDVRDDGSGGAGPVRAGGGIEGMRERVALVGGALTAGARDGGGWTVHAALPLEDPR